MSMVGAIEQPFREPGIGDRVASVIVRERDSQHMDAGALTCNSVALTTRVRYSARMKSISQGELAACANQSWRLDTRATVLEEIHDEHVSLVSWQRTLPAGLEHALSDWAHSDFATLDAIVPTLACDLSHATAGIAAPYCDWLVQDLALLVERFGDLTRSTCVRVCFGAVRTDQCRKFHYDYLRFRLITTYVGPGTEWLPDAAVDWAALAHPVTYPTDANQQIVRRQNDVRRANPGDVLVLKGAGQSSRRGAVHRSPPIEASGAVRVVLAVSTLDAP